MFNAAEDVSSNPNLKLADAECWFKGNKLAVPAFPDSIEEILLSKLTWLIYKSDPDTLSPPEYGCNSRVTLPEFSINEPESSLENLVIYPF